MSKLTDLLRQVERNDPQLAADLEREYKALSSRRAFGLNFERHYPESTEIPGRTVRKGEKVRVLPPRGSRAAGDKTLWVVQDIERVDGGRVAHLVEHGAETPATQIANVDDLVVVSVFRDFIYPGLVSTGKVERGGDKPFHTVINGENYHALKTLTYTHEGKIDAIYIDPPYNTGAKDWKYNNDYVEGDDLYRHSKWLAFMERRLLLAKQLLNPKQSILIVTIDEKEYLRLGLLLEQVFDEADIQMVTSAINPKGSPRSDAFSRVEEYLYFVSIGTAAPARVTQDMLSSKAEPEKRVEWVGLRRRGSGWQREARPFLFYPIYVEPSTARIVDAGEPLPLGVSRETVPDREGLQTIWPLNSNGQESRWQMSPQSLMGLVKDGFVRTSVQKRGGFTLDYLSSGQRQQIKDGIMKVVGRDPNGAVIVEHPGVRLQVAKTVWNMPSHDATTFGSRLLSNMMPDRRFPFPKSLYAIEDALRFYVKDKPEAVVLDFFAGSGTAAHAVMRLNRQDNGRRQCISVTNNEVGAEEQKGLRNQGLRPGDPEWEQWGICDYITKPRLEAAVTGNTPQGDSIKGDYKFIDEFPISEGLQENVEFFALTYETRTKVKHHLAFRQIAPLLWLRAGARGECIKDIPEAGWALTKAYGVLVDLDVSTAFVEAVKAASNIGMVYIVTNDTRRSQSVAQRLPAGVEVVRLYESYLQNFQIRNGG
ncbi:site-specific DNA-methyltransferase [Kocuria sp. SM24M-10]|uniref:site-specific DNA-methyltransferase n=1 Tax=Kocuria sp. SM24M-10 TaxID=1660349 RepID=UPI0009E5E1A5|nr:DNA methyltransferase [Kocuria sp. SM24M-10]